MLARIFFYLLFLLLNLTTFANAITLDQLQKDFATIRGHILMPVGEEYLIDLDASTTLNEGDIVTLMAPGEKIIHPISKEIVGTLEMPQGYLTVTRLKSGYSYVKPLTAGLAPKNGDVVVRFDQVPALITTATATDRNRGESLQAALPQFEWLAQETTKKPLLTFTLDNGVLTVNDPSEVKLYQYDLSNDSPVVLYKPEQPVARIEDRDTETGFLNEMLQDAIKSVTSDSLDAIDPKSGAIRSGFEIRGGAWFSPAINGGPSGIAAADLDGDGFQETAMAMRDRLLISRIEGEDYRQGQEIEIPGRLRLLTVESIDLDGNQLPELYLTAVSGETLRSFGVEYRDGAYRTFATGSDWYLRTVTLPQRGKILLGQKRGPSGRDFSGPIFRMQREQDRLIEAEALQFPKEVNIFSFTPISSEDGKLFYAYIDDADHLVISTPDGLGIWQSQDYFGGSELKIDLNQNREDISADPTFIGPRLLVNEDQEILVIQNYGQRVLARSRFFGSSRLVAFKWTGAVLEEHWSTPRQNGYMPDFTLADINNDGNEDIAVLIQIKRGGMLQDAKSSIITYDQNK